MTAPQEPEPRRQRYSVRYQVRLDAETGTKLTELAIGLHRKRAAILRYVMQWGLTHTHEWTIAPSIPARPHLVHMLVEPERLQQVQEAAESRRMTLAITIGSFSSASIMTQSRSWRR